MTRQSIIDLIDKKLEEHETLNREDLYEIGIAHKSLPKADRGWSWLNAITGHQFGSGEGYRNFVLKTYKKRNGEHMPIKEETSKELTVEEQQAIYKERQKLRDERTNLNALLRDESRVEKFREELQRAALELKNLPTIRYTPGKTNTKVEAVALLSDLHLGMQIDEYCNKYNIEIATKRLDKWTEDVIRYCRANSVKRLNVVNLGDLIQGEIHPSIRVMQQCDVAEQVMKAGELLARALNRLQEAAPEVVYRSVSDNHSRFMPDLHQSIERENFFRLIDWWLEARLAGSSIMMPKDNVNFRTGKFRLMNGQLCMFEHGHKLKVNESFQAFVGMVEEYVHYVFIGHYHCEKMKTFQNMRVFVNGSICGTDPYADGIHKYTKPKQTLLIFDEDNLINFSIDLNIRE